ncbi:DoxX family protein [Gemmatimonas sp.]|uniref:DoxX family protein n=1 Tax=Gemmatimonas sp. TaxID=1962908 RepID=UPI0039831234
MPPLTLNAVLQLIVGIGLLNVWVVRSARGTAYRGGGAQTLREEFAAYRLPDAAFYLVGAVKVIAGVVMLAGLWWPLPVRAAAGAVVVLMVGAIMMHIRIKDPVMKSVPAVIMLVLCLVLVARG